MPDDTIIAETGESAESSSAHPEVPGGGGLCDPAAIVLLTDDIRSPQRCLECAGPLYYYDDAEVCPHCSCAWCQQCGGLTLSCEHRVVAFCDSCSRHFPLEEMAGNGVCRGCELAYRCRHCGTLSYTCIANRCEDCRQHECGECGDITEAIDNYGRCPNCSSEPYCERCGQFYCSRHPLSPHHRGLAYRPHVEKRALGEWDNYTKAHFQAVPYLGIELEVECASDCDRAALARRIEALHHNIVATSDGSLDYGIEIKCGPVTLVHQREIWPEILAALRAAGAKSWYHDTTGTHIHVSGRSIARIYDFQAWAFQVPYHLAYKIYGRYPGHYAHYRSRVGHYAAVSISNNWPTIEFRQGKGSLSRKRLFAIAEFVVSQCAYWNIHKDNDPSWWGYWQWLHEREQVEYFSTLSDWLRGEPKFTTAQGFWFAYGPTAWEADECADEDDDNQ